MSEREKLTLTVNRDTAEWLENEFQEALELQEAVRMAIQDSRDIREAGIDIDATDLKDKKQSD